MDNIRFFKSFNFRLISKKRTVHTDNSHGIDTHFFARMKLGSGRIAPLGGCELSISEGDVFYLPLGLRYHSYWFPSPTQGKVEWESYAFTYFPDAENRRYSEQILRPDEAATELLERLSENMNVSPASVGLLYSFFGAIAPTMGETNCDRKNTLFLRAVDYISAHPDFCVPDLARYCDVSESSIYALFKTHSGLSPIGMKNKILTEQATALLGSTDLSVEEISSRLGFCSAAYFRKIVKSVTGKTPSAIRKEQFAKYNP